MRSLHTAVLGLKLLSNRSIVLLTVILQRWDASTSEKREHAGLEKAVLFRCLVYNAEKAILYSSIVFWFVWWQGEESIAPCRDYLRLLD